MLRPSGGETCRLVSPRRPDGRSRRPVTTFLRAVGRLWRGMGGILPPSRCPRPIRIGNTACWVFTNHETRDTRHESWPLLMAVRFAVGGQESRNQKLSPDCRARQQVTACFATISRQKILLMSQCRCIVSRSRSASSQAPSAVESCESAQNPVSAGGCTRCAVARNSRRPASSFHRGGTQNEPMLRKENVLDCANRRTFYIALTRPPEHASELQAALFTLI